MPSKAEYEAKFQQLTLAAHKGLLEPNPELVKEFGEVRTLAAVDKVLKTYRDLIEKAASRPKLYFSWGK